mmetsp:Transcript_14085/g.46269  ORF Transcript_14085/g.46269 Transcript_14085/m.46269 type:complete len:235 (+) Transcript_14085:964-1668(+)
MALTSAASSPPTTTASVSTPGGSSLCGCSARSLKRAPADSARMQMVRSERATASSEGAEAAPSISTQNATGPSAASTASSCATFRRYPSTTKRLLPPPSLLLSMADPSTSTASSSGMSLPAVSKPLRLSPFSLPESISASSASSNAMRVQPFASATVLIVSAEVAFDGKSRANGVPAGKIRPCLRASSVLRRTSALSLSGKLKTRSESSCITAASALPTIFSGATQKATGPSAF